MDRSMDVRKMKPIYPQIFKAGLYNSYHKSEYSRVVQLTCDEIIPRRSVELQDSHFFTCTMP